MQTKYRVKLFPPLWAPLARILRVLRARHGAFAVGIEVAGRARLFAPATRIRLVIAVRGSRNGDIVRSALIPPMANSLQIVLARSLPVTRNVLHGQLGVRHHVQPPKHRVCCALTISHTSAAVLASNGLDRSIVRACAGDILHAIHEASAAHVIL